MTDSAQSREAVERDRIAARLQLLFHGFTLDVDVSFPMRGITALFGASGSGKTSLLRSMAGLERARGSFRVGNDVWQDDDQGIFTPTHRRSLGFVFQEASLFSHLSVMANLEYGRRRASSPLHERELRAVLELLGIVHLLHRMPGNLSGGERQRVAIARALALRPRLLLMDEPMASLDQKRKLELLPYLERLREEQLVPIIYVSHSIDEVARLSDHVVVLECGQVVAAGPIAETMARVDLSRVFGDEDGVVLDAHVAGHEADELTRITFSGGHLFVGHLKEELGQHVRCRIHARDVSLALSKSEDSSILNVIPAVIEELQGAESLGVPGQVLVRLRIGKSGTVLLARVSERSRRKLALTPGAHVFAQIKSVALFT